MAISDHNPANMLLFLYGLFFLGYSYMAMAWQRNLASTTSNLEDYNNNYATGVLHSVLSFRKMMHNILRHSLHTADHFLRILRDLTHKIMATSIRLLRDAMAKHPLFQLEYRVM